MQTYFGKCVNCRSYRDVCQKLGWKPKNPDKLRKCAFGAVKNEGAC